MGMRLPNSARPEWAKTLPTAAPDEKKPEPDKPLARPPGFDKLPEFKPDDDFFKNALFEAGKGFLEGVGGMVPFGPAIEAKSAQVAFQAAAKPGDTESDIENRTADYMKLREEQKAEAAAKAPVMYGLGSALGFGLGAKLPGGEGLVTSVGKTISNPIRREAAEIGTRVGLQTGIGAAEGGLSNPYQLFDPQAAIRSGALSGLLQGGFESGRGLVEGMRRAGPPTARFVGKAFGGVEPQTTDKYLAKQDELRSVSLGQIPNMKDDLSGQIRNSMGEIEQRAISAKSSRDDAKLALDDAQGKVRNEIENHFVALKSQSIPENIAPQMDEALATARKQVSAASGEAFDLLSPDTRISMPKLKQSLQTRINGLQIAGTAPLPGSSEAALYNQLNNIRDHLDNFPKEISAPEAKALIQQVDSIVENMYDRGMASYNPKAARDLVKWRQYIDSVLKENGAYSDKMAEVARKTQVLANVSEYFGSGNTHDNLMKLGNPKSGESIVARRYLKDFDNEFQSNLYPQVEGFVAARKSLSDPQYKKLVEDHFNKTYDIATLNDNFNRAEALNKTATSAQRSVGAVSAPGSKISDLGRTNFDRQQNSKEFFQALRAAGGPDYLPQAENIALLEQFTKGNTNGSRNVNFWSNMIQKIPAVGPVIGFTMDKYGPAVTKHIMDIGATNQKAMRSLTDFIAKGNLSSTAVQDFFANNEDFRPAVQPNKYQRELNKRE